MLLPSTIAMLASQGGGFVLDAKKILPSSAQYIVSRAKPNAIIIFKNADAYLSMSIANILRVAKCKVIFDVSE